MEARVFRRLNEGTNLRSRGTICVSLLLDQMMKMVGLLIYQESFCQFSSNTLVNFYSV